MMFDAAARSVVKVFVAASWLAAEGVPLAGALLGEGDIWLDEAGEAASFAGVGVLLGLAAGDIAPAAPAAPEEAEGAEDEAAVEFVPEIGTGVPLPPPITQPGTRSLGVALAGPSVTATQTGKFGNKLPGSSFS